MKYVNLTPHDVNIYTEKGELVKVESSGLARCKQSEVITGYDEVNGSTIEITRIELGYVTGLPDPKDGVVYIVSRVVADAVKDSDRDDIRIPGPAIRDDAGRVIGCRGLSII